MPVSKNPKKRSKKKRPYIFLKFANAITKKPFENDPPIFIECTISQLEGVEKSGLLRLEAVFSDIGTTTLPYLIAEDGSVSNA